MGYQDLWVKGTSTVPSSMVGVFAMLGTFPEPHGQAGTWYLTNITGIDLHTVIQMY